MHGRVALTSLGAAALTPGCRGARDEVGADAGPSRAVAPAGPADEALPRGEACISECAPGEARCEALAERPCVRGADGCWSWGQPSPCTDDDPCTEDRCGSRGCEHIAAFLNSLPGVSDCDGEWCIPWPSAASGILAPTVTWCGGPSISSPITNGGPSAGTTGFGVEALRRLPDRAARPLRRRLRPAPGRRRTARWRAGVLRGRGCAPLYARGMAARGLRRPRRRVALGDEPPDRHGARASCFDEACADGWADTAPVGSGPAGASAFGVEDMAGNAWEWVDEGVLVGGAWFDRSARLRCPGLAPLTLSQHRAGDPLGWLAAGFRCCQSEGQ